MKKILIAIAFVCSLSSFTDEPAVNEKVLESFNKTFVNVQELSWSESPKSYEASFKLNDIRTRVTYDKEGMAIKTMRYYGECHLPIAVLTKVKNRFSNKKIFGVTEVSTEEDTVYHIVLEDEKTWLNISASTSGDIEKGKTMRKA